MQEKTVWFGTEDDLVQVKCPSTELTRTRVAWRNSGTYLNGGVCALSSGTAHEEASISWGADSVDGFATLMTQLNKGEPLYYLDPLACKTNILPPYAAQYQPNNPFGFVAESATGANGYPATAMKNLYVDKQIATIPVPSGYNLWVGCKGDSGGVSVDAPPPKWVEVARNLATNPNWERLTMDSWSGHGDSIYSSTVVDADWTGSGKAGLSQWAVKVDERGNSGYSIIRESQLEVGRTYTFVQRVKFGQAGRITPYVPWAYVVPKPFDAEPGEIVTKYITFVYSAEIPAHSRMSLNLSSKGENVWIEYGDPLIYEGEYDPDREWFSGDHAPEGMRSEWLGEPNNSASVLYEQEEVPDDPDLPDVTSIRCEGNTRTWPTVQFTATATAAQTVRVTVGGFTVDVAGPFTAQDTAVLDYDLMRFELFREGVKVASLVPRMSTLDRLEIRPQDGWIPVTVEPVDGGTVSDVKVKPNSRKQ